MKLEDLGYNEKLERFRVENNLSNYEIGRVTAQHKERYIVRTINDEFDAEITGNLRFSAKDSEDFPAVGDWVTLVTYDKNFVIINNVLPRKSIIKRQAAGEYSGIQVIAANIDYAFIIQAVDRDFNINRLERYLTICYAAGVIPIIIMSKIDLIGDRKISELSNSIMKRIKNVRVILLSNNTKTGYDTLTATIERGKTYCMLGSSGVGKSTLLNNLSGKKAMRTDKVSQSTKKGKHVTSHRELFILDNGGILIDNPGMREVGIADTSWGLDTTFDIIARYANKCKYKDCSHIHEAGCAVKEAVEKGEVDRASYANYLKMSKENAHFKSTVAEKKKKEKELGKIIKNYKKTMKRNKL